MERAATARRELVAEPTRLPAAVDLSRLEVDGAGIANFEGGGGAEGGEDGACREGEVGGGG